MSVHSTPGQGTRVCVVLPATDAQPSAGSTAEDSPVVEPRPQTVLVVDDEPAVRRLAARTLERLGFTVLQAEDGAVAVEMYEARLHEIDGVLLDMTMPVMGGREALRRLRELDPDVRVLMSSGYNDLADTTDPAASKTPFLQKPYLAAVLGRAVIELLAAD